MTKEVTYLDKVWQAKWITDPRYLGIAPINVFHKETEQVHLPEHRDDLKNQHMLVRKIFQITSGYNRAYIDITADDYYKLYINGVFVGQGPAPGYYFNYKYNHYDIRSLLKKGSNILAVHVYYQGLINRVWNSGDYRQGMIAEVYVDDQLIVATDDTWKYQDCLTYKSGGITGYDTQYLENIDARLWDPQWRELGFNDAKWDVVTEKRDDDHVLVQQESASVSVYQIQPQQVQTINPGHYLIDFGQEITGSFTMRATGQSGFVVEIRYGEELTSDGLVRYEMRCNCKYQEYWTLSGREDVLEHYDYKAFRYIEVLSHAGICDPSSFAATVRHYPLDESKTCFDSSNLLLNQIWQICKTGVQYGTQESYLDCPTREKGQYLGDVTITGHAHLLLTADYALYKKALQDFADSTFVSPGLLAVAPGSFMQEIADYSLQWPSQVLLYYHHSGDLDFLTSMYPYIEGLVNYFSNYQRDDGLLENVTEKWNLVDWPENLRDGYDFPLSRPVGPGCHNVLNAFYYGMLQAVQEIRSILGKSTWDLSKIKTAFLASFYDPTQRLFVDREGSYHSSLHANALPLLYDLAPQDAYPSIVSLIETKGFSCGVYMAYFVLKALAKADAYQLIYDLICNESEHSWANMVREGATTCYEAWGKEQKWNTSLCHPWASGPIPVIIEDILGVSPKEPGWQSITFNPHIPKGLDKLMVKFPVKTGIITVNIIDGVAKLSTSAH